MAVWGIVTGDSVFGIVAIDAADNVLHVVLCVTALVAGLAFAGRELPRSRRDAHAADDLPAEQTPERRRTAAGRGPRERA